MKTPILLLLSLLATLTFAREAGTLGHPALKKSKDDCNFKYKLSTTRQAGSLTDVTVKSSSLQWLSSVDTTSSRFNCSGILTHGYHPGSTVMFMPTLPVTENLNSLQCSASEQTLHIYGLIDGTYALFNSKMLVFFLEPSVIGCPSSSQVMIEYKR